MALLAAPALHAQEDGPANEVKINLPSLAFANFSLQYERSLAPHLSAALGVRFGPERSLPFTGLLDNATTDDSLSTQLFQNTRINNYAFTPEVRYYFGNGLMKGFYIGLFGRFGEFNVRTPFTFDDDSQPNGKREVLLKGGYSYGAVGLQLGAKWNLSERISLDWFFLGPMYMTGTLKADVATDLSQVSDDDKKRAQQDLKTTFDNATVDNNGVRADWKLSLPSIRSGLAIGFRF